MFVAVMISINEMIQTSNVKNRLDVNVKLNTPLIDYYEQEKLLTMSTVIATLMIYQDIKRFLITFKTKAPSSAFAFQRPL